MYELKKKQSYSILSADINVFVNEKLANYRNDGSESKTIHDPIWGSNEYSEWEMQIIDSPLLQRLRDISQVGLAVLTYPAARHSRFEHTLGVAAAAKRLIHRVNINSKNFQASSTVINKIVLAALLHDVGHCFYSHLSERVYSAFEDFANLMKDIKEIFGVKPKPHEVLSMLIVNSPAFKDFFEHKVNYPEKNAKIEKLLEDVGKIIIGVNIVEGNHINSYQTSIINGPFDVDKLDYIKRDSHTAGLALDFDIERLFTKIQVHSLPLGGNIEYRLVIQANGVTAIEELTFSKIMLFSYIYYHQKVLITESIIEDFAQALIELNIISCFADFLRFDETHFLELANLQDGKKPFPKYGDLDLKHIACCIRDRVLPKRCLEISQNIIQNIIVEDQSKEDKCRELLEIIRKTPDYSIDSLDKDIQRMISHYTRSNERYIAGFMSKFEGNTYYSILEIRKQIYNEIVDIYKREKKKVDFGVFDIFFVLPSVVSYGTPGEKNVLGRNGDLMSINDFVKLEQWASSFNAYKWRGYVFVTDKIDKKLALEACNQVIFDNKISLPELRSFLKY